MKLTVPQLRRLVGNPNVYAVQHENGNWNPVREPLTPRVMQRHLRHEITVGTYLVHMEKMARTLVLDFDSGDSALSEAEQARAALEKLGVPERAIGLEFSGNKGYHLWVVCAQYIEAAKLRRIGKAALAIAQVSGEVYPKQDTVRDLGNLVKLPGGVHQVTKNENNIIGTFPQPAGASVYESIVAKLPQEAVRSRTWEGTNPLECMAHIQEGAGQGWRNHGMFHFATNLRRSGLEGDALWAAMVETNKRFDPPLDDEELASVFDSSGSSGPICDQLPEEYQCATCPYKQSRLYAKPGQLRHGKEGEMAVVQLGVRRRSGAIELVHPDLETGLVQVKGA